MEDGEKTLSIWVWKGPIVLKNYTPGVVVITAHSAAEAWLKLLASDAGAFMSLWVGEGGFLLPDEQGEVARWMKERANDGYPEHEDGFPIRPESFALADLPVIIMRGGS